MINSSSPLDPFYVVHPVLYKPLIIYYGSEHHVDQILVPITLALVRIDVSSALVTRLKSMAKCCKVVKRKLRILLKDSIFILAVLCALLNSSCLTRKLDFIYLK